MKLKIAKDCKIFNEWAKLYDKIIWDLVPPYKKMLTTVSEVVIKYALKNTFLIDLGIGTANLEERIIPYLPNTKIIGYDFSPAMKECAESKFKGNHLEVINNGEGDIRDLKLPSEKFYIIVSTLTLHYISNAEKQKLIQKIYKALKNGGMFILGDRIVSQNQFINSIYNRRIEEAYKKISDSLPLNEQQLLHFMDSEEEMPTTLGSYLKWLGKAGFPTVECIWKEYNYVIIIAIKDKE